VLIARSILVTLPAYVALLGELGLLVVVFLLIRWGMGQIRLPHMLATAAYLYLLLMGSHLLGRFYWRRKEKLGWGL
jgi:energy-coupling factor transporter transmembrane protein EcfT